MNTALTAATTAAAELSTGDLETIYDSLAQAIDQCGEDKAPLFLVKLALLNARHIANPGVFEAHINRALQDLA